jgi:hypothetical protein
MSAARPKPYPSTQWRPFEHARTSRDGRRPSALLRRGRQPRRKCRSEACRRSDALARYTRRLEGVRLGRGRMNRR